jgi:hypothetical protein
MTLEESFIELEQDQRWMEIVIMGHKITPEQFTTALGDFKTTCLIADEQKTVGGLKRYFSKWLPYHKNRLFNKSKHEQRQINSDQLDQLSELARNQLNGSANPER